MKFLCEFKDLRLVGHQPSIFATCQKCGSGSCILAQNVDYEPKRKIKWPYVFMVTGIDCCADSADISKLGVAEQDRHHVLSVELNPGSIMLGTGCRRAGGGRRSRDRDADLPRGHLWRADRGEHRRAVSPSACDGRDARVGWPGRDGRLGGEAGLRSRHR